MNQPGSQPVFRTERSRPRGWRPSQTTNTVEYSQSLLRRKPRLSRALTPLPAHGSKVFPGGCRKKSSNGAAVFPLPVRISKYIDENRDRGGGKRDPSNTADRDDCKRLIAQVHRCDSQKKIEK